MKKKFFALLFLFSVVFNGVAVVYLLSSKKNAAPAQIRTYHLSESQHQKIRKESEGFLKENRQLEKELEICRQDLYNLLNSEESDRGKIEDCITAISSIQKKIQMNTVEQLLIYKKHLDEEQCRCFLKEFGTQMKVHHSCDENCGCGSRPVSKQ